MFDLFSQGGPVFMGILTLILLALLTVFIMSILKKGEEKELTSSLQWLKSIGTLGLVVGVLGQLIGLYSAFSVMETAEGISPSILAGGLRVSLITTLYGVIIFVLYLIFSMILKRLR